jgi:nucleoside-diphosphate-sugar epimerase
VRHLLEDDSYTKIYTLSRSKPGQNDARIEHATLDLQSSAKDMAKSISGISAEYIFFCAYLANPNEEEAARINGDLLSNFIHALEMTGAVQQVKRFILTCGFKHYGVHLGLPKQPLLETDPRLEGNLGDTTWPANFYYTQQNILKDAAARESWEWVCTLPNDVIGYATHNFMNEATALALYCTISKVLPGSQLIYPGNQLNYLVQNCWTSADLHAKFCLWAAKAPGAGNNLFNVINGDVQSFQEFWPRMAERFGCEIPENMFNMETRREGQSDSTDVQVNTKNPIVVHAKSLGLTESSVSTQSSALHLQIDPQKWAQRADVLAAWDKLKTKYGLDQAVWDKATWDFLTFVLGREWGCVGSMSKARKLGWTGYEDTWESFERTFENLEKNGVIPSVAQLKKDFSIA